MRRMTIGSDDHGIGAVTLPARERELVAYMAIVLCALGAFVCLSLVTDMPDPLARLITGVGFLSVGLFTAAQVWLGHSRMTISMSIIGTVLVIAVAKSLLPPEIEISRSMPAYVLLIGVAGLLVGRRAGWLVAALCVTVLWINTANRVPISNWSVTPAAIYDLVVYTLTYGSMAFVTDYAGRRVSAHFEQATTAQRRLEEQHRLKDEEIARRFAAESQLTDLLAGMRAVVESARELLACETHERLWRRAVELPRERLGIERCSIYLYEHKQRRFTGTFGTSINGHTTDERLQWYESDEFEDEHLAKPFHMLGSIQLKDFDGQMRVLERTGWVVQTPIRTTTGEPVAVMFNDTAISGEPVSGNRQELLVVYCALLGAAIERLRLEKGFERAAVADERARLARELHDSVSQALFGISLGAHAALQRIGQQLPNERPVLDYILNLTQGALAEMRALIFELRPESLAQDGLIPALRRQVEALTTRHKVKATLVAADGEPNMPIEAKEALYRIAIEATQNTVKHAQASEVDLRLSARANLVELEIADNGAGFDTATTSAGTYGLLAMRERAERLKGHFHVTSAPGNGTRILVQLPVVCAAADRGSGLVSADSAELRSSN
jgi:signal transduction histidine kinase